MPLGVITRLPRGLGLWRSTENPAAVADQGERAAVLVLLVENVDLRLWTVPC